MQIGREDKKRREGSTLLSGVMLLTAANVLVKILGFFYKVPLNALLGDEMANVNAAYAIYAMLYTVSTAGVPSAVSLSVSRARARDEGAVRGILRVSLGAFLLTGALLSVLLFLLARPISLLNSGGDSYLCLLAIAPALFFAAVNSVLRGYFQGYGRMEPTAVSELLEAMGKTLFGLLFALLALRTLGRGVKSAAALSVLAISLGVGLSAAFLLIFSKRSERGGLREKSISQENGRALLGGVLRLALPITAAAVLMSLSSFLDALLMRPLLYRYYGDADIAKMLYSDYSTGALTLYNLPSILITPMSAAIIPYIAAAVERGEERRARGATETALRAASLISLPCALGMSVLASPILTLVFRSDDNMARNAGGLLSVLSIAVFFVAVFTVTGAALQAAKKERLPLVSLGVGIAVKLVALPVLTLTVGEMGVPISTLLFYAAVCTLNLYFVRRELGIFVSFSRTLLSPALAALFCALTAWLAYFFLSSHLSLAPSLLLSILAAVVAYLGAVRLLKCISEEELRLFPHPRILRRLFK